MAIVLPQGKFNNATLAYIREWILRHARLLAVVGLHPNTFKPHTGTKTSILFLQKYTDDENGHIMRVKNQVELRSPNYRVLLKQLLENYPDDKDLAEEDLPGEVSELLHERFASSEENSLAGNEVELENTGGHGSEADIEALEVERAEWEKTVGNLSFALEEAKRQKDKEKQKKLRAQIREAEKKLVAAIKAINLCTLKGRLELLLEDPKALEQLRQKWIDAEVAKKLDYPVFMATSERGGKDSSGEYMYRKDQSGNVIEDENGNPLIDQDCIKYRDEDSDGIAEQFVTWAKKHKLIFWLGE
jgi:type I restriction enzyme M protein